MDRRTLLVCVAVAVVLAIIVSLVLWRMRESLVEGADNAPAPAPSAEPAEGALRERADGAPLADLTGSPKPVSVVGGAAAPSRSSVIDNDKAEEVSVGAGDGSRDGVVQLRASQTKMW